MGGATYLGDVRRAVDSRLARANTNVDASVLRYAPEDERVLARAIVEAAQI